MVDLKVINGRIKKIGNGENTFKQELGVLSRELLDYVPTTGDIDAVNRLIAVLSPLNKEKVTSFFKTFLAHKLDKGVFGKKSTNKDMVAKRVAAITSFLSVEDNTVWTWLAEKGKAVKREAKPKALGKAVEKAVEAAISTEDNPDAIGMREVLKRTIRACIGSGMKLSEIMTAFEDVVKEEQATVAPVIKQEIPAAPRRKAA
jgi:hypothetical protein